MLRKLRSKVQSWKSNSEESIAVFSEPLKYTTLGSGQIRILLLHPGNPTDPLRLSLGISQVSNARNCYKALSYVWGSPEKPHKIRCGFVGEVQNPGKCVEQMPVDITSGFVGITTNLYEGLFGLRDQKNFRILWVDSICIDQESDSGQLNEKSHQIGMMFDIYRNASSVIIWLGSEKSTTKLAFECFERLDEMYVKELRDGWRSQKVIFLQNPLGRNHWDAFRELLYCPWFQRLWVFQESVANVRTTVKQGAYEIQWERFERACQLVTELRNLGISIQVGEIVYDYSLDGLFHSENGSKIPRTGYPLSPILTVSSIASTRWDVLLAGPADDKESLKESPNLRLKYLLPLVRGASCADVKDKVFGILSLALFKNDLPPRANYSLSVKEVYMNVVEYWLQSEEDGDLGFLNHVQNAKEEHQLPSWVPDWSTRMMTPTLIRSQRTMDWNKPQAKFEPHAASTSTVVARLYHQPDHQILAVNGVALMVLEYIEGHQHFENLYDKISKSSLLAETYPQTRGSYLDAFQHMLQMCDSSSDTFSNFWNSSGAINTTRKSSLQQDRAISDNQLQFFSQLCQKYEDLVGVQFDGFRRKFFLSDLGFMGLAPFNACPGDIVCIFFGAATPFVVRHIGEYYQFIGECYVQGIMNGEAMTGLPDDRIQEFLLT